MIPASVRIFVCTRPHDMRCSYDTLALAAQQVLGQDPRSGALLDRGGRVSSEVLPTGHTREKVQALTKE